MWPRGHWHCQCWMRRPKMTPDNCEINWRGRMRIHVNQFWQGNCLWLVRGWLYQSHLYSSSSAPGNGSPVQVECSMYLSLLLASNLGIVEATSSTNFPAILRVKKCKQNGVSGAKNAFCQTLQSSLWLYLIKSRAWSRGRKELLLDSMQRPSNVYFAGGQLLCFIAFELALTSHLKVGNALLIIPISAA